MGCFWHRCPRCNLPLPKSNVEYWKTKFELKSGQRLKIQTTLQVQFVEPGKAISDVKTNPTEGDTKGTFSEPESMKSKTLQREC